MRPHEDSSEKRRKQQQKHQEQGGPKNMMHIQKTRKRWEESICIPTGKIENLPIRSDSRSEILNCQGKFRGKFRFFIFQDRALWFIHF